MVLVLDPTLPPAADTGDSGPDVATLAGTSGFHVNDTWEDEGRYFAQLECISDP